MKAKQRIGIAGAGLLGRLLAWQLIRNGYQVSLFDKDTVDHGGAAAYTAAGMLTPYSEVESAEWGVYNLGMQGLALWPELVESLQPYKVVFKNLGSLVVSHAADFSFFQQFQTQLQHKNILPSRFVSSLNNEELRQLEPNLAKSFDRALHLPQESWICPQSLMSALAIALSCGHGLSLNLQWFSNTRVQALHAHKIITATDEYDFDYCIDCRGMGAKTSTNSLRGVRGELIWVQAPEVDISHMLRLMHPRYRLYLVPRGHDDLYVLGATQIESEDYSPVSVRSSLELLSALYSLHPGFAEARIVEMKSNCRPAYPNNLPRIDIEGGLIRANGLFRHGYLLAPVVVKNIVEYLNGEACSHPELIRGF